MPTTSDTIALQPATKSDAEEILWLEEVCMKAYAEALWGNWRASDTVDTLDISNHEMITQSGKSVGCIATRLDTDGLHLLKLYLAPHARNHGIGAVILRHLIGRAAGHSVLLRVLVTNPAVRFYERNGFRIAHRTDTHVYMVFDASPKPGEDRNENH